MGTVRRYLYSLALSLLSMSGCISLLWFLALCGTARQNAAAEALSVLVKTGDFWLSLLFTLLSIGGFVAVLLLMKRARRQRKEEVDKQLLSEREVDPRELDETAP